LGKFVRLKDSPSGEEAKELLRERMRVQVSDPKKDGLTHRLLPALEMFKDDLKGTILDVGCYTGFLYHHLGKPKTYT